MSARKAISRLLRCETIRLAVSLRLSQLDALDDECNSLADADAHGAKRVFLAGASELVCRGGDEPRAARAERMADRDRTAVRIHVRGVIFQSKPAHHRQRLR